MSLKTTLKPSKIKEITNFSRKTTLIRPQISKPYGAGMGGMKVLLHVNLAFVNLAKKGRPKSHPILSIAEVVKFEGSLFQAFR